MSNKWFQILLSSKTLFPDPCFEMDLYGIHWIEYESPSFVSLSSIWLSIRHSNCWIIRRGYPPAIKSGFLQVCWVRCSLFIFILPWPDNRNTYTQLISQTVNNFWSSQKCSNLMKSYYLSFNSDHGMSWVPYTQNTMAQHLPTTGLASPSGRPPNPSEAKGKIPMPESSRGGRAIRVRVRHRKSWWRCCFNEIWSQMMFQLCEYLWNIRYVLGPLCLMIMFIWRRYGCVYCTMKYDR